MARSSGREAFDQLIDYLANPNFDEWVAEWFCDRYLEYCLDNPNDEQVSKIWATAVPEALKWAQFIVEC